jgi:phage shock protein A
MSYLKKLYKAGEKKINELFDSSDKPLKAFEAELAKLKSELDNALSVSAGLKATLVRTQKDIDEYMNKAEQYGKKAAEVLEKAKNGGISPESADQAALQMLALKKGFIKRAETTKTRIPKIEEDNRRLDDTIEHLKHNIEKYKQELDDYKVRLNVNKIIKDVEQKLSTDHESGIVARLEHLKEMLEQKEIEEELMKEYVGDYFESEENIEKDLYEELKTMKNEKE